MPVMPAPGRLEPEDRESQTSSSFTVRPDFTDHSNGTRLSALSCQFTKGVPTDHPLRILCAWKANQKILITSDPY